MGVIKKEGIKQSVITYLGVLIGIANTMYFYPKFFSEEELGLFRFLIDTATLLFPFISLGIHNLSIRMFPTFKNPGNGHNGLLTFLLIGVFVGYILFLLGALLFTPYTLGLLADKSILIRENWYYIIPLTGLVTLSLIFTQYILNFKKVLLPTIVNDLFIKIGLPIIAIVTFYGYFTIHEGVFILLGIYSLIVVSLVSYIFYLKEFHLKVNWKFLNRPLIKEMSSFSFYGVLGSLGSILATRIDVFMIAMLAANDLKDVGVYSIALFMANVITVPARSINNISSPIIAESWKSKDIENIRSVYSKSSIVLLTLGLLFLIGIWSSIDDIFALMPNGEKFAIGKYVILILGIGKLFDLATGNNDQIIGYSKYFRFNFYAVLILAVLNVISNYIFIPMYQINGAALATTCSLLIFNISKTSFAYFKMGLHPFSINTLKVLLIGITTYLIVTLIPSIGNAFVDIILRSIVISILFIASVLYFNISQDLTDFFHQVIDRIKKVINN